MSFSVDTSGLSALIAKIKQVQTDLEPTINEALDEIADEGVALLKQAAPFDPSENNGTIPGEEGHLRDSFQTSAAENQHAEIITTEPIKFSYVTGGTDSPIFPVSKQAMWWPGAAHPVAQVNGQNANPFHQDVIDDLTTEGSNILQEKILELLQGL
jgi:hypothetical protein